MHFGAARVQVASEQGGRCQWFSRGPLHQPLNMLRLELLGRSAAWPIGQRGHACLAPVGVRNAHCAHVQVQLARHIFGKDARAQQQQCLRPFAFVPVATTLDDVLQLGTAVFVELKDLAYGHGGICWA